jgi:hypothetical protein
MSRRIGYLAILFGLVLPVHVWAQFDWNVNACPEGTADGQVLTCVASVWKPQAGGGGGAPTTATYITQTPDGTLSAEQAMSALGTGLVTNTTGTGVQSIYGGTGASPAHNFITELDAAGASTTAQPDFTDLSGTISEDQTDYLLWFSPAWRVSGWAYINNGATAWSLLGSMASPTGLGGSAAAAHGTFHKYFVKNTTGGTSGDTTGDYMVTAANMARSDYNPMFMADIGTDTVITNVKFFAGVISANSITFGTANTNYANKLVAAVYDPSGAAPAGNWQCCASQGTGGANTSGCLDTTVVVQARTEYFIKVYTRDHGTTFTCDINGTKTDISTNLPATTVDLGVEAGITTLENATKSFFHRSLGFVHD